MAKRVFTTVHFAHNRAKSGQPDYSPICGTPSWYHQTARVQDVTCNNCKRRNGYAQALLKHNQQRRQRAIERTIPRVATPTLFGQKTLDRLKTANTKQAAKTHYEIETRE